MASITAVPGVLWQFTSPFAGAVPALSFTNRFNDMRLSNASVLTGAVQTSVFGLLPLASTSTFSLWLDLAGAQGLAVFSSAPAAAMQGVTGLAWTSPSVVFAVRHGSLRTSL